MHLTRMPSAVRVGPARAAIADRGLDLVEALRRRDRARQRASALAERKSRPARLPEGKQR